MISVAEALDQLFALVEPTDIETVPLTAACGRQLAEPLTARRNQPPFAASSMDGYAVIASEVRPGASFRVIGEAAAGRAFSGSVSSGEAVRIFTGAPVPEGADRVVIQEDAERDGDSITLGHSLDEAFYVRPLGGDFHTGDELSPRLLTPSDIALIAAMNHATVPVRKRPVVAILPTGDELVQPGEDPGPDQIVASNSYGLHALLARAGAEPRLLPIAKDTLGSLEAALTLAEGADLVVTIGGASVGDHDLVGEAASNLGLERSFYKIAMRPGKPLMAGRLSDMALVGLPGNPVSAMVCGHIFILPMIACYLGRKAAPAPRIRATLTAPLPENGPREHYMRARRDGDGIAAFERQDSALLTVLADANALLVRPPHDPARQAGETVEYIDLSTGG
ncbi:gephyrin-like molybdotransferase Glp [Pelagovum pacificum]|uniref:Molybdopterin molybdenumtransferase n=1 Tax=Pelagovum pacificum TaxID=2588711 RepID=A0A5C5GCR1_9RHOB|nr:gephyrin-like molybdotransferase Glp [Pelagovum pacificum]QQA44608.1 molybdopterin molybdotransferase MoeA [Pelagovum pacificum]TNY32280.1 molybdopterin molybdotransferase MoeA [Pelagovum pacificum]